MLAVSVGETIALYLIPLALVAVAWLALSLVVLASVRSPLEFDFKHDLLRKLEEKRALPSGAVQALSLPYVAKVLLGDYCVQAAFLYRVSRFLVRRNLRPLAEAVHALARFLTHADLSPWAEIGPGLYLYHGVGTVVGKGTRIGRRALICQGVSLGGGPEIGDDVKLWAGAKVIGRVTVGDRSEVGANAVVIRDVPADSLAVGVPARVSPRNVPEEATEHAASESMGIDGA